MVNFHDPATIAQDYGAYAFPLGSRGQQRDLLVGLFLSGCSETLALCGWSFYVSLYVLPH